MSGKMRSRECEAPALVVDAAGCGALIGAIASRRGRFESQGI